VIKTILEWMPKTESTEISLEANPGSIDAHGLAMLRRIGINRLSLGVQSLEPDVARLLARGHTAKQAQQLLQQMPSMGFRSWSADLIFAVPGQTLEMLDRDIDALLEARVPHISLYGLTIETGTVFAQKHAEGSLTLPSDDQWLDLFERIQTRLLAENFEQYEVSNFALPGHRSVHNGAVWRGGAYVGLGPSAHGFAPDGRRWKNPADLQKWLQDVPPQGVQPTAEESAMDYLLSSLRHIQGSDLEVLARISGLRPNPGLIEILVEEGLLHQQASFLRLAPRGVPLADGITRKLCNQLEPSSIKASKDFF
jgi:oxygen-independent coproporphyrinogen-3 oxidase